MYLAGFSINNLTLMALTIATGFVVDDAIVMIENIARYIEEGEPPLEAALKGAEQIGFTIISLTLSLIAVLIPLLFMGEVVGRLFREFAITLAVAILISARGVAHAHADDVREAPAPRARARAGRVLPRQRRCFDARDRALRRDARLGARAPARDAVGVRSARCALTVLLYIFIPKGFFPVQDTGVIQGISEAPQSISFPAMAERQQALARAVLEDPAVESLSSFIGVDGINITLNSGRMLINLKPLEAARRERGRGDPAPAGRARRRSRASRSTCSRCRTSPSRTASAARSTSSRVEDANPDELRALGAEAGRAAAPAAAARRRR